MRQDYTNQRGKYPIAGLGTIQICEALIQDDDRPDDNLRFIISFTYPERALVSYKLSSISSTLMMHCDVKNIANSMTSEYLAAPSAAIDICSQHLARKQFAF